MIVTRDASGKENICNHAEIIKHLGHMADREIPLAGREVDNILCQAGYQEDNVIKENNIPENHE